MRYLVIFGLILGSYGCGSKHKVELRQPEPFNVAYGPSFEKGMQLCDERYGYKTIEAEKCFNDYRTFFKVGFELTPGNIGAYCESLYTLSEDVEECKNNLENTLEP